MGVEQPTISQSMMQTSDPSRARGRRRWPFGFGTTVLLLVIVAVVCTRWPLVKEMWYSLSGTPAPSDGIAWRTDYAAARAESAKTGKPLLLDFSASWCPPCQAMRRDTWPDHRIREMVNARFIPVALDADDPRTQPAARRYDVQTIPRVIIIDADGHVLRDGQYMSAGEMLDFLKLSRQTARG